MIEKYYLPISILIAVLSLVLIFVRLDRRQTHVRRLILIAVLTTLSIAGRFIFAAIPFFKPMTAVIILTGIYLGPEAGFLCGSLTALLSNIYFGQGPWTPFQMLALGGIGALAYLCFGYRRPEKLERTASRVLLLVYGAVAGVLYSIFMDLYTVLWAYDAFNTAGYVAALTSAIPVTILYMVSNVVFLFLFAKPFHQKVGRAIMRYRL